MRLLAFALVLSGCATMGHHPTMVGPPKDDRCLAQGSRRGVCVQARGEALTQVRRLAVDDQICIDGLRPLADDSRSCTIRAFVEGVAPNAVQLEIRDAPVDSKYKIDAEYWFDEGALAEVQLRALGYALPDDAAP